jgi:hypothetical protein
MPLKPAEAFGFRWFMENPGCIVRQPVVVHVRVRPFWISWDIKSSSDVSVRRQGGPAAGSCWLCWLCWFCCWLGCTLEALEVLEVVVAAIFSPWGALIILPWFWPWSSGPCSGPGSGPISWFWVSGSGPWFCPVPGPGSASSSAGCFQCPCPSCCCCLKSWNLLQLGLSIGNV